LAHRNGNIKLYRRLTLIDEIFMHHPMQNVTFNEEGTYLCCVCRSKELFYYETDSGRRNYIDASPGLQQVMFLSNTEVLALCLSSEGVSFELFDLSKDKKMLSKRLRCQPKLAVLSPDFKSLIDSSVDSQGLETVCFQRLP